MLTQDILLVERALTVILSTLHTILRAVSPRQYHPIRDRLVRCSDHALFFIKCFFFKKKLCEMTDNSLAVAEAAELAFRRFAMFAETLAGNRI